MKWTANTWMAAILGGIILFGGLYQTYLKPPEKEKKFAAYAPAVLPNEIFEYWYVGEVVRVIDGDTIDATIGLGMDVTIVKRLRLAGINAPEMSNAPKGQEAKQFLESLITDQKITIKTAGDDTDAYGRTLATIFVTKDGIQMDTNSPTLLVDQITINVNDEMVKRKHAEIY